MNSDSEDESDKHFQSPWTVNSNNCHEKSVKNNKDDDKPKKTYDSQTSASKLTHQKSFGWEIVEGIIENTSSVPKPDPMKGILYHRRKWPMKGWGKVKY